MFSQGTRAAYRELVVAIPARVAILGMIDTNNPHVPEDLQPMQRPAPLPDAVDQWHLWAERACPHMPHVAFPIGAFFQVNNHQGLLFLLGALHVYDAKPLHFHAGPKRVAEMGATAQQRESQILPTLFAQPPKA